MKPKVSICIPTYKQTNYLRKSLESIVVQTYNNFEIIITDDSPDDSIKDLLKNFDFKGKLKYFKNKYRLGTPENWNEAIKHASGAYIKILHHDDWFKDENSLSNFVDMLEKNPQADFAFSASEAMDEKKILLFVHESSKQQLKSLKKDPNILFFGNFIGAPSATIYRKNTTLKYDKNLKWLVDIDFYIQILNINKNFIYSKKPLVQITARGDHQVTKGVEKNKLLQIEENLYLYKKIKNISNALSRFLFLLRLLRASNFISLVEEFSDPLKNIIPKEIKMIVKIKRFVINIKKIIKKINFCKNKYEHISFSQCGEDLIVEYIFTQLGIQKPSYLDLGAYHPFHLSNTYLFYKKGSSGVCVEPNPDLFKKIKKKRRRDTCLNMGVGVISKNNTNIVDFYVMSSSTLSTFSKEEADRFIKNEGQKIKSILKVPILSVNQIIIDNYRNFPNFISIDIEGLDFDILKDFDFEKFQPEVFCIETLTFTENTPEHKLSKIIEFMQEKNYFVYADTYINTIFVNKQIWENRHEKH